MLHYFDIHTHILFDVDHGVSQCAEMETILDCYKKEGFSTVIMTPHIYHPAVECKSRNIRENFAIAQDIAAQKGIRVILGSELYLEAQENILSIPICGRYSLVEFPVQIKPVNLEQKLKKLIDAGFIPIIAHIERYTWLKSEPEVVDMFLRLGCLIQVNVCGIENREAIPYIRMGIVDVIGSDNHGDKTLVGRLRRVLDKYPSILEKMQNFDFE